MGNKNLWASFTQVKDRIAAREFTAEGYRKPLTVEDALQEKLYLKIRYEN
jgi:hypothetical protein